jgi:outer membrane protein OmpA-like peptidoglycan-associated protein
MGPAPAPRSPQPQRAQSPRQPVRVPQSGTVSARSGISRLQRDVGNRGMHRLLQSGAIQAKLTVGPADDHYEREADRVADEVMRMPDPSRDVVQRAPVQIQRMCPECEEELHRQPIVVRRASTLQRKCPACEKAAHRQDEQGGSTVQRSEVDADEGDAEASPELESYLAASQGAGQTLSASARAFFEPRFGQDFGHVRVHTDARAAAASNGISARAFTIGSNIYFGHGQYRPGSDSGDRLLGHELTHVVQQGGAVRAVRRASRVQRQPSLSRAEEVRLSFTSPGEMTGSVTPPKISLYNFAIEQATLKETHRDAIDTIGTVLKRFAGSRLYIAAYGHTDSSGDETEINVPLSRKRAMTVRQALQDASGLAVDPSWFGEGRPEATNDTVGGRSRNRRVDIYLVPVGGKIEDKKKKKKKKNGGGGGNGNGGGGGDGNGDGDGDGDGWSLPAPCQGLLGVLICGVIACALAPEICLFCMANPRACFGGPTPPKPPKRPKGKQPRPCVVSFKPPPNKKAVGGPTPWGETLMAAFEVNILFKNDDTGCTCARGEYKQEIFGVAKRDHGTGVMQLVNPPGVDTWLYTEDRDDAGLRYGIRSERLLNEDGDAFTDLADQPDRPAGCKYHGSDLPGIRNGVPGERMHMRFKFRGAPVDRDDRSQLLEPWAEWVVEGDYIVPHTA